jgi:predicted O-linked N-acetylglucosamine transferase (SPINDLY family)
VSNASSPPAGPSQADIQRLIGLLGAGTLDEAIAFGETLARQNPGSLLLCQVLGAANVELKRYDRAALWFERALQIRPDVPEVLFNLGVAKQELERPEEAIASYERVIRLKPDYAEAHHNLGSQYFGLGRHTDAIACFRCALALRADYADAHYNLGVVLLEERRIDEAIAASRMALRFKPDHADALCNLGLALQSQGEVDEAYDCYRRAVHLDPGHAAALGRLVHLEAHLCDWQALAAHADRVPGLGVDGDPVPPFGMLSLEDDPARHRTRSEKYGATIAPHAAPEPLVRGPERSERLRIGYFSADFHNHATMYLMARLFELHDRSRFAIHIYSYGPDRDDEMRRRLSAAVDRFHDVRSLSDAEVADLARREGIDIAVDLKGYTQDTRLGIFAWRPAPVQISWLGYPGTLGVPFIDYLVADPTLIPAEQRRHYSEKIIYLPDSYQVNDDHRPIAASPSCRADLGLPDRGFVFACFNNSYKISAQEFDIWMRLLHRVEGSILWLLAASGIAEANLRREAERRGIAADRLVFAPRLPQAEHLARHAAADLFLDTFHVNAHTTASDALWAGLPLLTMAGKGFVARVAASLLRAIGLPELIVETPQDYEQRALDLATDPVRLAALRERLAANRATMPPFDTARTTRQLEAGFATAFDAWVEGREGDIVLG